MAVSELLLAGADERDLTKLKEYQAIGGYKPHAKARRMKPEALVEELIASHLRGRGGAGFPRLRRASMLAKGTGKPTYLGVNADQSQPHTFKDRRNINRTPHKLLQAL